MSSYKNFSLFYDLFTYNVNYKKRTKYLLKLFEKFDRKPTLLLDLACGTGGFSFEFAKKGIEVIGVDMSEDMLCEANLKNTEKNKVLFLCQRAEELELYGTVDGAVCCLDSLNHITNYEDFKKSISKVSLFLEPQRLFIFDVNTPYKHQFVLGDNTFKIKKKGVTCIWENKFSKENNIVNTHLTFIQKDNASAQDIIERAYSDEEIQTALNEAGLEVLAVFGENTFKAPKAKSCRNIYITRKA